MLKNDEIQVVFNTTEGTQAIADSSMIRRTALRHNVYCTTTIAGALAVCEAVEFGQNFQFIQFSNYMRSCIDFVRKIFQRRRTIMPKVPMTVAGAETLGAELNELKTVQRPKISLAIADARSMVI